MPRQERDGPTWTNGQAERMNWIVKVAPVLGATEDATTKAFHCETAESLRTHAQIFLSAYNFAKHLKALRRRTSFQAICNAWKADLSVFKLNPHHLIPRSNA